MVSLIVLKALLLIAQTDCARILAVLPIPSISHQVVFQPLTQELVKRGHELTVITPNPAFTNENRPKNLTEIDVHDISYQKWTDKLDQEDMGIGKRSGVFQVMYQIIDFIKLVVELQLNTDEVQGIIRSDKKFDLLLIEACVRSTILWSHVFKAPVIQISSFGMMMGNDESIGALTHPTLYPTFLSQRVFNLTFWEKLQELYTHYWILYQWYKSESAEHNALSKYFGENVPTYKELNNNIDMLFLNIHPIWTKNQPMPPNAISLWGIHKNPQKPLPQDLQNYMDASRNGVIYLSLGSNARSSMMPKDKIKMIINVFTRLPYNVLWKWEKDHLQGISKNIKISKWFPQTDVLRHPNMKLFITQGGLQSTDEAIDSGVPLIGIPMFSDQWYNVEFYEHHKIGVIVDFETITEERLLEAINTVINDKSYKENIKKLRDLLNDQPESALERAVWWTEYVLRRGAKHLRAANANITWFKYYEVDFILKLLLLTVSALAGLILAVYYAFKIIQQFLHSNKQIYKINATTKKIK